jgi:AraC-like DNA-binding protein
MNRSVDVLWIARYDYEPGWRVLPHRHEYFQLIYILDGTGTVTFRDREIPLGEDRIVALPPGEEHAIAADRNEPLKTLDTKFSVGDPILFRSLSALASPIDDPNHRVRNVLERMRIEGMKQQPWFRELCNALLIQGLIALLRGTGMDVLPFGGLPIQNEDTAVTRAKSFIDTHYAENLSVRDIASAVGYSPEYLTKRFGQSIGISLHAYLMRYRIERAKEMLKYEEASVKEVTFLTGFKTVHHFTRTFKEIEGIPPATWRDQELSGVWKNVVIAPGFVNEDRTVTGDGDSAFRQP